jgi:hypothetical protein
MGNKPHRFLDRDVQRAIRAARSAGLDPGAVEINPRTGLIRVIGSKAAAAGEKSTTADPLKDWITRHHADQA